MQINLNNCPEQFEMSGITVSELLIAKNFTFKMLIVKINGNLIRKEEYDTAEIHEGDEVQALHLISGG
jgi:thiamine biosynthesis protein ThiS